MKSPLRFANAQYPFRSDFGPGTPGPSGWTSKTSWVARGYVRMEGEDEREALEAVRSEHDAEEGGGGA